MKIDKGVVELVIRKRGDLVDIDTVMSYLNRRMWTARLASLTAIGWFIAIPSVSVLGFSRYNRDAIIVVVAVSTVVWVLCQLGLESTRFSVARYVARDLDLLAKAFGRKVLAYGPCSAKYRADQKIVFVEKMAPKELIWLRHLRERLLTPEK